MLKEFLYLDFGIVNSKSGMVTKVFYDLIKFLFPVAITVEFFKVLVGRADFESRIVYLFLALISVSLLNTYSQSVLEYSFASADKIILHSGLKSLDGLKENFVSKTASEGASTKDSPIIKTTAALVAAEGYVAKNLSIAATWILSLFSITLLRQIYSMLYLLYVIITPVIAYISIVSGFEGSLKALWQAFVFFALAPIVLSGILWAQVIVSTQNKSQLGGIETLVHVVIMAIFLILSFVITGMIVMSQPISSFAKKASLMGAMTLASPFIGMSHLANNIGRAPVGSVLRALDKLPGRGGGASGGSRGGLPKVGMKPKSISDFNPGLSTKDISNINRGNFREEGFKTNPHMDLLHRNAKNSLSNPDSRLSKFIDAKNTSFPNTGFNSFNGEKSKAINFSPSRDMQSKAKAFNEVSQIPKNKKDADYSQRKPSSVALKKKATRVDDLRRGVVDMGGAPFSRKKPNATISSVPRKRASPSFKNNKKSISNLENRSIRL